MAQVVTREEEEEERRRKLKKEEEKKAIEVAEKKTRVEFEEKFRPIPETKPIIEVAKRPVMIEPEKKVIEEYERKEALAVPEERRRTELIARPVVPIVEPKERDKILKELVREERARQRELIKEIWDKVEEAMYAERKRGITRDYVGRVIARLKITGILRKRLTSKIKELVKKLAPKMAG